MSLREVLFRQRLRTGRGGVTFRRPHPVLDYVLDFHFYCARARLAIGIDGEAHARGDRPTRDLRRDAALAAHGLTVLRTPARAVLADVDAAAKAIVAVGLPLHSRLRRRSPFPSMFGKDLMRPVPRTGELLPDLQE